MYFWKFHKSYIYFSSFLYYLLAFFSFCLLVVIIELQTPCFTHQIVYHRLAQSEKYEKYRLYVMKRYIKTISSLFHGKFQWFNEFEKKLFTHFEGKYKLKLVKVTWSIAVNKKKTHNINKSMLSIYKWKFVEKRSLLWLGCGTTFSTKWKQRLSVIVTRL